jgi:methionine aminopeptidase
MELGQLRECGSMTRDLAKEFYGDIDIGEDILNLAKKYDNKIQNLKGGYSLLCPTTIEMNYFVNNCSPSASYQIAADDLISYCLAVAKKIPGKKGAYAHAKVAYTKTMTPIYDKLVQVTSDASRAALKECGVDVPLTDLRLTISEILESSGFHTVSNVCGTELYNSAKIVPNSRVIPEYIRSHYDLVNGRMRENEVYFIDVYGTDTSADVEAKPFQYPSIYYALQPKRMPHRKSVSDAVNCIKKHYGQDLFSIRDFRDKFEVYSKVKLNKTIMSDLDKGQYIFPVTCCFVENETKDVMNVVSRFGHSIHIGAEKNTILC